ncbi:hypothetical protein GCM10010361_63630 [Streptomyces olivaceiscleroticus]|uniref:Uncharacterized protein n=1 Tax=Streptomyces olivaceiscleroticus TaxID=68245 RepID=A0ABN1B4L0_9ACTN
MRTTVASLVPVRSARPVTVSAAQPAGSPATASATRCMERVMDGPRVRTLAARAAGAGGAPAGWGRRAAPGPVRGAGWSSDGPLKVSFNLELTTEK